MSSEQSLQPLPDDIAGLLDAERAAPVPVGVECRVLTRVEQTVAAPSAPAAATGAVGAKTAVAIVAVIAAVGVGVWLRGAGESVETGEQQAVVGDPHPGPVPEGEGARPQAPEGEGAAAPMRAPHPGPVPEGEGAQPEAAASGELEQRRGSDLAAERALLDVAQTALADGDVATALHGVGVHHRRYRRGVLAQEREVLWIRALVADGDLDAARARADRFARRYPRSIQRGAVDAALREGRE